MINPQNAVGKPFIVRVDDELHTLGNVTNAAVRDGKLFLAVDLDLSQGETEAVEPKTIEEVENA